MKNNLIPNSWTLTMRREGGSWMGSATKMEGVRQVTISTYDSPRPSLEEMMQLIYERIKL